MERFNGRKLLAKAQINYQGEPTYLVHMCVLKYKRVAVIPS